MQIYYLETGMEWAYSLEAWPMCHVERVESVGLCVLRLYAGTTDRIF